ncbi:hypothetical protein FV288_16605 [Escherichia coli]|nr:hypothetical protein FV288_16605 [Escherichia coli]
MSLVTDLPAIFDQFSEARQKGFLTVMDLKERGIPLVGTYCTFMPQEIPMAAGAVVVSLCSTSDETIEEAEKDLPRNLCPLIKSSYGFGKTDKCPYFYFSDLVVGETTCDGKKKMYEYMAEFKPVHVMQLPNSVKDDASRALWKAEMLRLQKAVEERFGHEISEDALRDAIALKNRERRALANFYHLGQLNPPALSGSDILKVVYGATFRFDKEALINELDAMTARVRQQWEEGQRLALRPRILITGCPIGGAAEKVVRAIEENGGLGARFLAPATRAVIDIGGQDSKVIQLDDDGNLCDFLMNDKCAAGTGRFLEVISRTLGTSVEQLDSITENVTPHAITSMCTVFAESEVISLRSAGVAPEAILAGVINAMARRSANFIARLSCEAPILFTGGVSHCQTFARMLESHLGMPVNTHPDAQFAGAIGAAVIGQRVRTRR